MNIKITFRKKVEPNKKRKMVTSKMNEIFKKLIVYLKI